MLMFLYIWLPSGSPGCSTHWPFTVEMPAMEGAAEPVILAPAIAEIGAAMWAMASDEAEVTLVVAEQHEVLAEQAHRHHRPR